MKVADDNSVWCGCKAGGAKDPDFWRAFKDREVKVIGDEFENSGKHPDPLEKAIYQGEGGGTKWQGVVPARGLWRTWPTASQTPAVRCNAVCLTMKLVGEPDAGDPHVRFDERGGKTELRRGLRLRRCHDSHSVMTSIGLRSPKFNPDWRIVRRVTFERASAFITSGTEWMLFSTLAG